MTKELRGVRTTKEASVVLSSVTVSARQLGGDGSPVGDEITLGGITVDKASGLVSLTDPVDGVTPAEGWQLLLRERGRESRTTVVKVYFEGADEEPTPDPDPDPDPEPEPDPEPPVEGWPIATNTGYLGDAATLRRTRGRRITTPGTVIQNEFIDTRDGALIIDAANVTVRNCVFVVGIWGVDALDGATNLVVEDCTFEGGYQAAIGLSQARNWRVSRCNFHGGRDAIKPGGSGVIEDNYMHDPDTGGDAHNDCIQFSNCDGVIVRRNRMEGADTSCIAMFDGQATFKNVTIEGNHMTGAGYILYAGGRTGTNIKVRGNVFGNWGWGPVTDWAPKAGHEWSGNITLSGAVVNP